MLLTISPNQPQLIQLRSVFITVNACVSQHLLQTADKNTLIFLVCLDMIFFLVADTQLYESLCRSVGPLVCPSVSTSRKVGKRAFPPLPTRPQLVSVYPALFSLVFHVVSGFRLTSRVICNQNRALLLCLWHSLDGSRLPTSSRHVSGEVDVF